MNADGTTTSRACVRVSVIVNMTTIPFVIDLSVGVGRTEMTGCAQDVSACSYGNDEVGMFPYGKRYWNGF